MGWPITKPSKTITDHIDSDDKLNNESLSSLGQRGGRCMKKEFTAGSEYLFLTKSNVGSVILQLRTERGLTQVELAEEVGISRSYLAGVERGRYHPSLKILFRIAEVLGVYLTVNYRKE